MFKTYDFSLQYLKLTACHLHTLLVAMVINQHHEEYQFFWMISKNSMNRKFCTTNLLLQVEKYHILAALEYVWVGLSCKS